MHVILQSFILVLASEMGDKTQLLALVLASRFRKPWTIMAGILVATVANHGLASWAGVYAASMIPPAVLKYGLAASFFAFAAWVLIPDKDGELSEAGRMGAFVTTVVAFFLAEMGDKTQLATVALGATFGAPVAVTIGTTMGMLVADGVAVFFGERLTSVVPMRYVRRGACALFALFGIAVLVGM
jgi:putative Ca2+/H+ antiporter (TMEM165/GDT1 family)